MKRRIFCLLLALMMVLSLCACGDSSGPISQLLNGETEAPSLPDTQTTDPEVTEAPDPTVDETEPAPTEETVQETMETNPTVVEETTRDLTIEVNVAFYESLEFDGQTMTYQIPEIMIGDDPCQQINDEIWYDLYICAYRSFVEDSLEVYDWLDISNMAYDWSFAHGILSITCWYDFYGADGTAYYVYNVLVDEARLATDAEVLEAFGMSDSEFRSKATDILGTDYYQRTADWLTYWSDDRNMMAEYSDMLGKTVDPANIANCKPFVGPSEGLFVLGTGYIAAGSGSYQVMSPINRMIDESYKNYLP